ncbi:MAG: hypothetical protein AAFV77_01400 [Planctomycetota bacterium]
MKIHTQNNTQNNTQTIEREGKKPLIVRVAKRSQMGRIHQACQICLTDSGDGQLAVRSGDALMFQEMVVRFGIVEWDSDLMPVNHPILGDIAPVSAYDELTDDEVVEVAQIVQGGTLTEDQRGN